MSYDLRYHNLFAAIVAFLLLFATFAVGLRCFADFDKGLQSSKTHGQSYRPVSTKLTKLDLFGDYSFPISVDITARRKKYSSTAVNDKIGDEEADNTYAAGHQLQQRISIE
jgi:hypothetical protein